MLCHLLLCLRDLHDTYSLVEAAAVSNALVANAQYLNKYQRCLKILFYSLTTHFRVTLYVNSDLLMLGKDL